MEACDYLQSASMSEGQGKLPIKKDAPKRIRVQEWYRIHR